MKKTIVQCAPIQNTTFAPAGYNFYTQNKYKMRKAINGDSVQVHYHGRLDDGTTFDSSANRDPLQFTIGSGMVIAGFDNGVMGMQVGDKKTIHIPANEAYGQKKLEDILAIPREQFPNDLKIEIGMTLTMANNTGQQFAVIVTAITPETITVDANHPLAGKDLTFDLEMVKIG